MCSVALGHVVVHWKEQHMNPLDALGSLNGPAAICVPQQMRLKLFPSKFVLFSFE